jgi:hypothetical protein
MRPHIRKPISILSFFAVDKGASSGDQIAEALAALGKG